MEQERVQKLIAQAGIASRRKAEELINKGAVKVNGKVIALGDKASFKDRIEVNGVDISKEEFVYIMLNKPDKTVTTASDPQKRLTVLDLVKVPQRVFPVGRLDYDTTGTLLLTNDGELSNRLIHPSYEVMRVYRARLSEALTEEQMVFLNSNKVIIDNKPSKQKVLKDDTKSYTITLGVGSYHHIKKLFELVDRKVITLTRIEFAGLSHVGELSKGEWRFLKPREIKWLKQLTRQKDK